MKKLFTLASLLAFFSFTAQATFTPVALTGFNEDVVANGSGPATGSISADLTSTYNGIDNGGDVLVSEDFVDQFGETPPYFLPTGGLVSSVLTPGLTFQLADYTANNALFLVNSGDTGLLSFVTPSSASTVYLCGLSAAGASDFDVVVNFSDGTSQTFQGQYFNDWYLTPPAASVPGIGRVIAPFDEIDFNATAQNPHLFEIALNLSATNYTKTITGVKITKTNTTGNDIGNMIVMGITTNTPCSGTPTAGTVAASISSFCSEYVSTLSLTGSTTDGNLAYQWQSSSDGITYSDVSGATNATYNADVTTNIYYRDSITCTISGENAITPGTELLYTAPQPVIATLPFSEGFENWFGTCYTYDRPDSSMTLNPVTGGDSWRRDDQGSDANWTVIPDGAYSPASVQGAHSARFHVYEAEQGTSGSMDLHIDLSDPGTKQISFFYINNETQDNLYVELSENGGAPGTFDTLQSFTGNGTGAWTQEFVNTNSVAANAVIRFEAWSDFGVYDQGMDSLNVVLLTPCSGTPDPGAVAASQSTGCTEYISTLTATASTTTGGITYQWESSNDGTTFAPVNGATNSSYTADVTANVYYEVIVTCTASGQSATTAPVELQMVTVTPTYATLPYFQGFENWIGTCYNYDRPDNNWTNSPNYGDASWRRDDQGGDAGWDYTGDGTYTPASSEGLHSARFHTSESYESGNQSGLLSLYADFSATGTKVIQFDYINVGEDQGFDESNMTLSISTDNGNTWTQLGSYNNNTTSWTPELILTDITAPQVIIQWQANPDYDYGDMGIDSVNVFVLPPCSGTPVAGSISTTQLSGCSEFLPTLSVNAGLTAGGLTYQWYSSADGVTFAPLTGATNFTYAADITASTYFYCQVTCTASEQSDTSTHIEELLISPVATYATIPYFQGFENWIGTCFNYDRPDNSWITNPSSGNNSWRRDDQGFDANWSYPNDGTYSPVSTELAHSARFHAEESFTSGTMDLYVDLSPAGSKLIAFDYMNTNEEQQYDPSSLTVMISTDSVNWTTLGTYEVNNGWTQELLSTSITQPAIIRFQANSDYAYPDLGIDSVSITILPPCGGMPTAGTFSNTQALGCVPFIDTMTVDAPVYGTGISYQWQSSPDGSTWTSIANATNLSYSTSTINNSEYYRFYVKCSVSDDSDFSAAQEITYTPEIVTTATLPYFQGFESWVGGACYAYDRPDSNWIDTPAVGDASWRRNDQGTNANWDVYTQGAYSPTSTEGSYSARFHNSEAASGAVGTMDLHINLSPVGTKEITFDAINSSSSDLTLLLSEDNGITWTQLGIASTTTNWATQMFTTTSVAPNAILRLSMTATGGFFFPPNPDIGVDSFNVVVLPPCDGTPTAGTFTATQTIGCVAYESDLSVDVPVLLSNITYQWQSSTDGTTWGNISGATATTYNAEILASTYYRFIVKCTGSGDSDISAATEMVLQPEVTSTATLNYFQGFENWSGICSPIDRPDSNWVNSYTTGDYAWARDDQGAQAGWNNPNEGTYYPASTELDHSARFDTYDIDYGGEADLDLHVNLDYPGTKTITFDYMNEDGDDYIMLELSEDNGNTWTTLATLQSSDYTGIYDWQPQSFTTTSVASSAILRFAGISDYGLSDIGIDSLLITAPTCDTVSDLTVAAFGQTNASITWAASGTAGYEVLVNTVSADPASGNNTTANSDVETNLTPGTTYYVHVRDSCGPGLFSTWTTVSFTTLSCDSIANLAASNISDTGVTITWTGVSGTAGYEYVITTTSTTPSAGTGIATNSVTTTTLAPSTLYYVFVRDSCGPSSFSAWDTLSFNTHNLGIASVNGNFNVDAYPNPAKDIVTVRAYGQKGANRKVSLTDVAGRVIEEENMATDRVDFNMANLASGIYLIRYEDDDHTRVIKLNKQ